MHGRQRQVVPLGGLRREPPGTSVSIKRLRLRPSVEKAEGCRRDITDCESFSQARGAQAPGVTLLPASPAEEAVEEGSR
jgi:hypothetical protein